MYGELWFDNYYLQCSNVKSQSEIKLYFFKVYFNLFKSQKYNLNINIYELIGDRPFIIL